MTRVVAGVDSSTQSTTVVLRDAETGVVIGRGSASHPPTVPPVSEHDPRDWWSALIDAMAAARGEAGVTPDRIVAISVAGQCHGLVPLDGAGNVIRKVKLWNDTTSFQEAEDLIQAIGRQTLIDRIGSLPTAAFTITKIAWLARHEPDSFAALSHVLLPHDWLTYRLTGRMVTDRSEASGTGYYNAAAGRYEIGHLECISRDKNWRAMLPEVLGPSQDAGRVLPHIAAEIGISPQAIVGPGAGDQHAGALGLGVRPGDTVFVLGTSGVVYGVTPDPVADMKGWVSCVADAAGGFQPLICTLNATKVTDAVCRLLGVRHTELSQLALVAPRNEERPVFVTYLDGERTPNRPKASGVLAGLRSDLDRSQLALAAHEGVVFGMVRGMRAIESLGVHGTGRLLAIGGGAASAAYRQIIADITGRAVCVVGEPEIVAAGAAVQAGAVLDGRSVQQQRELWAPDAVAAAQPRVDPTLGAVWNRYLKAAEWSGLEPPSGEMKTQETLVK